MRRPDAHGEGIENVRELPCGLLMLGLFFGEKASKGDNISIDLFVASSSHFAVVLRHFLILRFEDGSFCSPGQRYLKSAWEKGGVR